jgi:hypothetical protein
VIAVLRSWVERYVVADDPAPERSVLDVADGVR